MYTDIFFPRGNEAELLLSAQKLGFKEIIFLYDDIRHQKPVFPTTKLSVKFAVFVKNPNDIASAKARFDFVFAPSERPFFESKKVDFIVGAEGEEGHDFFYQRRGGLDDVTCKLARDNGVTLVFNAGISDDKIALGRMLQNARLVRKYKVKAMVGSFASSALDMRAPKDIDAFARTIKLF